MPPPVALLVHAGDDPAVPPPVRRRARAAEAGAGARPALRAGVADDWRRSTWCRVALRGGGRPAARTSGFGQGGRAAEHGVRRQPAHRTRGGRAQAMAHARSQLDADAPGKGAGVQRMDPGTAGGGPRAPGRLEQAAETHYRKALVRDAPDDNFLLVAYADFLLDRQSSGRSADAAGRSTLQSDTAFLQAWRSRTRRLAASRDRALHVDHGGAGSRR